MLQLAQLPPTSAKHTIASPAFDPLSTWRKIWIRDVHVLLLLSDPHTFVVGAPDPGTFGARAPAQTRHEFSTNCMARWHSSHPCSAIRPIKHHMTHRPPVFNMAQCGIRDVPFAVNTRLPAPFVVAASDHGTKGA